MSYLLELFLSQDILCGFYPLRLVEDVSHIGEDNIQSGDCGEDIYRIAVAHVPDAEDLSHQITLSSSDIDAESAKHPLPHLLHIHPIGTIDDGDIAGVIYGEEG